MGKRAAIYTRISQDRMGQEAGVKRQRDDAEDLCRRQDLEVADSHRFEDNDTSAKDYGKREDYALLMDAVDRGEVDVIVCWHMSRLWRNRRERAEGIEACKARSVSVICVKGPTLDMSTAYGRGIAGMLGEVDTMEIEIKSERIKSAFAQSAKEGAWHGGARAYGVDLVYDETQRTRAGTPRIKPVKNEAEAAVIVEAAKRALGGESLSSICRDLYARGIYGATGKPFTPTSLRLVLIAARISGRREYIGYGPDGKRPDMGEIVCDDADAPKIIEPEESDRLRRMLDRNRRGPQGAKRRWPLSGVLVCGRCKKPMSGKGRANRNEYVCSGPAGVGSCGRRVSGTHAEAWVRDRICAAFDTDEMRERIRKRPDADPDLYDEISRDEEELLALSAMKANRQLTMAEWQVQRGIVQARIEANRRTLARRQKSTALDDFIGTLAEMRQRWEAMNISQRRAVVTAAIERIEVNPARLGGVTGQPRGSRFDTSRFGDPVWKV